MIFAILFGALVACGVGTELMRRYAVNRAILDVPNERSAHAVPTPRGGGLAVATVTIAAIVCGWMAQVVTLRMMLAVSGGGLAVALVGWLDDRRGLSPAVRAIVHFAASAWAVVLLGGMPSIRFGDATLSLGLAGSVVAVVAIAWLINLYNFMDGIDGIAGVEAVAVGFAGGLLAFLAGDRSIAFVAALIACTSLGFLTRNWPPAAIFLGDVGSGFLGFMLGVTALASENSGAVPAASWAILLGVFLFDATATLLRRVARGERWYAAHRGHAYQRSLRLGWSHRRVTMSVFALDVLLSILAGLAWYRPSLFPVASAVAVVALATGYLALERVAPHDLVRPVRQSGG